MTDTITPTPSSAALALIDTTQTTLIAHINKAFDDLRAGIAPGADPTPVHYKQPTLADGHDPRNKNGLNLTPRGIEILYRVFDDGGGYNRAGKMLNITQGAAKNRKALWVKEGGVNRVKLPIDIDMA